MDEAEAAQRVHEHLSIVRQFIEEGAWYEARTAIVDLDEWMQKAQGAQREEKLRRN